MLDMVLASSNFNFHRVLSLKLIKPLVKNLIFVVRVTHKQLES